MTSARHIRSEGGIALLATLLILSVLAALTFGLQKSSWHNLLISNTYMQHSRLQAACQSGVNLGLALLQQDSRSGSADTLLDSWAEPAAKDLSSLFPGSRVELRVEDLSGRLPVNGLVAGEEAGDAQALRQVLWRLLQSEAFGQISSQQAREIVDSLVDWLDPDDQESEFGAEDGYYQAQDKEYRCRNGRVETVEELLLVKGIDRRLLYGSEETAALADYLTVAGDKALINPNTAPQLLLFSLLADNGVEMGERMLAFRQQLENRDKLGDPQWYRMVGGWQPDAGVADGLLTTRSSFFLLRTEASFDTARRKLTITVFRDGTKQPRVVWRLLE